jgi:aspartyl protease family protein
MSKFRTVGSIVVSGGFGGLAAVVCLMLLLPGATPASPSAPVARAFVDGNLRKVQIERGKDLSFKAPVSINGQAIDMLFDTGANVTVLSRADALRAGIRADEIDSHLEVRGINNVRSRLRRIGSKTIVVGSITIEGVPITVDDSGELAGSILGQDAFCNLARITIERNELELMHDAPVATGCSDKVA